MRRLRFLTNCYRGPSTNMALGLLLAFNAAAINAGGFLVLHMYTSHMTGFASQLADGTVLGNATLLLNALGAILAFVSGAAACAVLVNWLRRAGTAPAPVCHDRGRRRRSGGLVCMFVLGGAVVRWVSSTWPSSAS